MRSAIRGGVLALLLACSFGSASAQAVTIGMPDLNPATGAGLMCSPAGTPCSFAPMNPSVAAPFDGVITRWRVRVLVGSGSVQLRILRPPGPTFLWATSS